MKPELSEKLFIEQLFEASKEKIKSSEDIVVESIDRLTGDASTRRYYRLFTNVETYVVCIDHPSEDNFNYFVEMQKFFSKHKVRVPKIYDTNLKSGYILEEDLGDRTLLQHLSELGSIDEELNIYRKITDEMLAFHHVDQKRLAETELFNRSFDYEKYMSEIEFSYKFFFKKFMNVDDEKTKRDFLNFYSPVCQRLANAKKVLTHRDFHSRNVMVKDGEYIVIDFQDARMGIPQYDLVSLLEDSYYDLMGRNKKELIKYYYDNLDPNVHGQGSFENFCSLYDDMLLQRAMKAIGSFSYIYALRKDVRYVKYIGYTMEKIRKTMMDHKQYDRLRLLLSKVYYES